MEIKWTKTAYDSLNNNLNYLNENWTYKEYNYFLDEVDRYIEIIRVNPYLGTPYDIYRKLQIVKQITLYYKISNHIIYLMVFWNNYKDPNELNKLLS